MQKVFYDVKEYITFDNDAHYSDCDCTASGISKKSKKSNTNNMTCVHTCPAVIKISTLTCDFVADDLFYELASHLTNITFYEKWNLDQI